MGRMLGWLASSLAAIAAAGCIVASSAIAAPPALPSYVPGELIVRFEPGTAASERSALNKAQGARERRQLAVPRAFLLRLPKGDDVRAAERAYERNPNVQYAQP